MRVLNQLSDMIYIVHWNCLYWLQYCYFTTFKITGVILMWKKIISKIGRGQRHFHYMLLCNDNISYRKHLGFLDGFVYMLPMSKIYCCIFYHCFYWKCNISEYKIVIFFTGHSVWWTKMIHQTESTFTRPKENGNFFNISLLMAGLYSFLYLYSV